MSNVFRRFHTTTGNEYWDNAIEIEIALTRFLMNEKNVPKGYRYIYTVPILNTLHRMQDWIVTATTIYPAGKNAEKLLEDKKNAFLKAICACEAVIQGIQRMTFVLSIDLNKLDDLGNRLMKESALLRNARKNSRVQQEQPAKAQ
jgi:hypothetical protein